MERFSLRNNKLTEGLEQRSWSAVTTLTCGVDGSFPEDIIKLSLTGGLVILLIPNLKIHEIMNEDKRVALPVLSRRNGASTKAVIYHYGMISRQGYTLEESIVYNLIIIVTMNIIAEGKQPTAIYLG